MAKSSNYIWGRRVADYVSRENPTLFGLLPSHDDLDLEISVTSGDPAATYEELWKFNRRLFSVSLLTAIFATILVFLPLNSALVAFASLTLGIFLFSSLRPICPGWHLLSVPIAITYPSLLAILGIANGLLFTALLLSIFSADRFASFVVHWNTKSPEPRHYAELVRSQWKRRFTLTKPLFRQEGYPIWLAIIATAMFIACIQTDRKGGLFGLEAISLTSRICVAVSILALILLAVEYLTAHLQKRAAFNPRTVFSAIFRAWRINVLYNSHANKSAGIYRPITGSCRLRRTQLWSLCMFCVIALTAFAPTGVSSSLPDATTKVAELPQVRPSGISDLQPYQQKLLERMPPKEQAKWKSKWLAPETHAAEEPIIPASASNDWIAFRLVLVAVHSLFCGLSGMLIALIPLCLVTAKLCGISHEHNRKHTHRNAFTNYQIWENSVERLQHSSNPVARDSLFMGVNAFDNTPILVPRRVFNEHAHILGATGSGKTSVSIISIMRQLIRNPNCSVVVLDLKGSDNYLFEMARRESAALNKRFRWHTLQAGYPTYAFNPLSQSYLEGKGAPEKADLLTQAMGLQHGRAYGRGFFSDGSLELATQILDTAPLEEQLFEEAQRLTDRPIRHGKRTLNRWYPKDLR